jgi:hypothetical protein
VRFLVARRGGDEDGRVETGRVEQERRLHATARHPRDVDRRRLRRSITAVFRWTRSARDASIVGPRGTRTPSSVSYGQECAMRRGNEARAG